LSALSLVSATALVASATFPIVSWSTFAPST
jgi:hypothetical protein